jgi:beta-lactam-binding protein with PASTA domain
MPRSGHDDRMHRWRRPTAAGVGVFLAVVLASCSASPTGDQRRGADRSSTRPTVTAITTTPTSATTPTEPGIAIPNIIGLKIAAARAALRGAGLRNQGLNRPCNKGTLLSQSVVDSLALPGKDPIAPDVGAVPVAPGTKVAPGSRIGIIWSGCYGDAVVVPDVVGLSFGAAKRAIVATGLTWACYSVGKSTTTTSDITSTSITSTTAATSLPSPAPTNTPRGIVLTQNPQAGGTVRPGATIALTMRACPQ